jgi:ABC-2 type transport system ATP-binding protein
VTTAIEVQRITKRYGSRFALDELELNVARGETVSLVGPNGAGKSTLLRIVAGLIEPTEGHCLVMGNLAGSQLARTAVSLVPDRPVLYEDIGIIEQAEYVARLHGLDEWSDSARQIAATLGIDNRLGDVPAHLSQGMRQKASILLALVRPFEVLLLDEPFVSLDRKSTEAFVEILRDRSATGCTIVVATHQPELVSQPNRSVTLEEGKVVAGEMCR